ncbi:MAG: phosphatidylglycerophosphatase A [Gammaproteobacteria bacterium]|nr:phosphatidylglycerophosphatase A [Gammaproteobacteria bacterium]
MAKKNSLPLWIWKRPDSILACGFGTGAAPFAPGTFGTLIGLPVYWLMQDLGIQWYLLVTLFLFLLGVWICDSTAKALGVHDHAGIVWDEVVGYVITMTLAPAGWVWWLIGFLLFRFFDIVKPWPIKVLDQRVGGGFGIMIDDVLAGIFAAICLQLLVLTKLIPV